MLDPTEALAVSETSLREKHRERMKAVNDETLIDLDNYMAMLIAKHKSQYRAFIAN